MQITEAIKARKSIRAFLPKPVPKQILTEVLELAARAPSWANTQPWEVAVIGGEIMEQVKEVLFYASRSGVAPEPDIPYPTFTEPYLSRRQKLGNRLYQVLGISREDRQAREEWALGGIRFFDAPNGFVFYLDRKLSPWSLLDLGLLSQSIMLAALASGLGTCPLGVAARYPALLRGILGIPDEKKIVYGMALGYPDWEHPINRLVSPRKSVASFARWYGF